MSKILHIVVCSHCPNLKPCILESTLKPALYCRLSTRVVTGNSGRCIPEWCELEDRTPNKVDTDRSAECFQCGYDCDRDRKYKLSCPDYKQGAND